MIADIHVLFFKKKKKGRNNKKKQKMVKPNINQRAISVQQSQNERNCPGERFYQVSLLTNQRLL